jgi:DNA-binding GntR family transcriptional regulator
LKARNIPSSHVDQCYEMLRGMIVRCEIAPGTRLTEKDLIARLKFGRTPVREALLRLTHDRIVDTKPRSGYQVRPLTYKAVDDFFIAWRAVAPLIAEIAFGNLTDEGRAYLVKLGKQGSQINVDDLEGFRVIASDYFDFLAKLADSEPLAFIYHRFGAEMDRVFRIFLPTPAGKRWVAQQSQLANWPTTKNPQEAANLISSALEHVHKGILEYMKSSMDSGSPTFWNHT